MRSSTSAVILVLLVLVFGPGPWRVSASTVPTLEAEVGAIREELAAGGDSALYPRLFGKVMELGEARYYELEDLDFQSLEDSELEGLSESLEAGLRAELLAVIEEWIAASPEAPEPYLALVELVAYDLATREQAVDRLIEALPDRVEGYREWADLLRYQGEEARAARVLKDFRSAHPDDPDALAALIDHHRATGNYSAAAELEREWLERFPEAPGVLLVTLNRAVEAEDWDAVERLSHQILDSEPAPDQQYVACMSLELGESDLAIGCFEDLLNRSLESWLELEVRSSLATHSSEAGDYERAEEMVTHRSSPDEARSTWLEFLGLRASEGDCAAAERLALEMGEVASEGSWGLLMAASTLAECGEIDRSRRLAAQVLEEADPELLFGTTYGVREILSAEEIEAILLERITVDPGNSHLHQAAYSHGVDTAPDAKVMALLLTWVDLDDESAMPAAELAEMFANQGRLDEAIRWQEEAVRRGPDDPERREALFGVLVQAGEEGWAGEVAGDLAVSESPSERLLGVRLLAELAREQGRLEEARLHYETYIEESSSGDLAWIDDEYTEVLRDLGDTEELMSYLVRRGEDYVANGWWQPQETFLADRLERLELPDLALPFRRQALAMAPDNAWHQLALGELLAELDRPEAAEHFGRAAALAPEDATIIDSVAGYLVEQGSYEKALARSAQAVDSGVSSAELILTRAQALRGLEELDVAAASLEDLLAEHADEHEARLELARIYDELGDSDQARHHYQEFVDRTLIYIDDSGDCNCYCDLLTQRSQITALLEVRSSSER